MSRDISAIVPLTPTQHGMLVDALTDDGAYVEQLGCTIQGAFDVARFEAAWRTVITRHDALRTSFAWKRTDTPMQVVHETVPFAIETSAATSLDALLAAERARGLDLAKAPVMRIAVAPSSSGHHVAWTHHHMLLDGWSVAIVLEEVLEAYAGARPRPRSRPFKDYVGWLGRAASKGKAAEAYWRGRFEGRAAGALLSDVVARGPATGIVSTFGAVPSAPLEALAREEGVTLSTLVQVAWALVVAEYTRRDDVVFGVTSAGRPPELEGVERMVGLFITTLPLRVRLAPHRTVRALVRAMHADAIAARPHEHTSLVDVHAWAGPASRVDGTLVFESYPIGDLAGGSLRVADLRISERTNYPWMLVVGPGAELSLRLDVDASRFAPETARRLVDVLVATLKALEPEAPLDVVVTPSVAHGPAAEAPSFVEAVLRQAAAHPSKVAIVCGGRRLTYRELVDRAHAIAAAVGAARVGIAMERSVDLPCAMLGVLLAGAAYVPLDLAGPLSRARSMVTQAEVDTILCDAKTAEAAAALGQALRVDEVLPTRGGAHVPSPTDLAYVLFTSGSTGEPKGVAVRRASVDNLLAAMNTTCGVDADDVWLAVTPITFDIAGLELFGPLVAGATVHLAREEESRDGAVLGALATSSKATVMQATPSMWRMILDAGAAPRLRAIAGGEGLGTALAARLLANGPLWNAYGPTETTIWSTIHRVALADTEGAGTVPIGRPLAETEVRVVDARGRPVPRGVAGELWLGGAGVAVGYVGDRERTRERFVEGRYRTGDRVRMREDGVLVWLGRDDGQTKIRGVRVEIGEVEAALERCPGVVSAAVTIEGEGEMTALTAWVVGDAAGVRDALRARLPDALIPSRVVSVASLPRTPHGKLDRRALLALETPAPARAPDGEIESVLHAIFCHVLGRAAVDVDASFFAEGGHSLLATQVLARVRRAFGVELPMASFFRAPTIRAQAAALGRLRGGDAGPTKPALVPSHGEDAPLTFTQSRLWFIDQLEPENPFYNLPAAVRLRGDLDRARLERALDAVVARQTSLRTTFSAIDGVPRQRIRPPARVPVAWIDMRGAEEAAVAAVAREEVRRPFDLARDLLLRVAVLHVAEAEHVIVLTMAHIAADGWSIGILVRELAAAYGGATLEPLAITVADVAAWQATWPHEERALARIASTLEGAPALALPTDRPRPPVQRFRGARIDFTIDARTSARLGAFARGASVTPFMALLAAFDGLLMLLSGQRDVSVGVPIANRTEPALEPLVGFFANTLVVRTRVGEDARFVDVLDVVRASALEAFDGQDVPFERLVARVDPERDRARSPLFQAMFVFQNTPRIALESAGLAFTTMEPSTETSKVDLELTMMEHEGQLLGSFDYDTDLFDASTVIRWSRWFVRLVEAMLEDPKRVLGDVELASPEERAAEVRWLTGPTRPWDLSGSVVAHIEAEVDRGPERIALIEADGTTITYGALDRRANAQARALEAGGVREGDRVGVAMDRSIGLLVAILGILKAGAAWVPLETDLPEARRARMAAGTKCVLRDVVTGEAPRIGRVVRGESLAYVIFTSGSTGRPKGVMTDHRGLLNRLLWMQETFALGEGDVVVQKTPIGFDVSVWELLWPLMTGARMVLAKPGGHRDPDHLAELFARHHVTTAHFVPSMLGAMIDAGAGNALRGLRRLVCSGEALTPSLVGRVRAHAPALPIHNLYGPTEASIDVTHHAVGVAPDEVPIGRPIANTYVQILDPHGRPALPGVAGELFLGGVQLARGYLDDAEETAARFVSDPLDPQQRIYRTGDRVRLRADGELVYLGRLDDQVKIRGVRVELGEIEAALVEHPEIRDAAVLVQGDGLVAWVAPRREALREEPPETRVAAWAGIFDDAYRSTPVDPKLHLGGWTSSFDGSAIPEPEMRRWVDATVARIRALAPTPPARLLEIGAGTGLVTTRLEAERHVATDISSVAVAHLRRVAPSVSVMQAAADATFDERFDVCVLSSVVQYFPSAAYLERVLANAIAHVVDGGAIFVGDVRNLALDAAFRRALGKARDEEELLLDPRFFWALTAWPRVASVTVTPKGGDDTNEMTTYRYDVVVRVGARGTCATPRTVAWSSLEALDALAHERVVVTGIPNARLVPSGVAPAELFARGGEVSWDPDDLENGALTVAFGGVSLEATAAPSAAWSNRPWEAARLRTLARRAKEHLRARLPEVMVPRAIGVLEELPRTASGKVDRKSLPARLEQAPRGAVILPRSEAESLVAAAFSELLGVERVSVDDSFFDLGGHSLLATRLVARVGRGLELRAVFESPTVEGIARVLLPEDGAAPVVALPRHPDTRAPLSFAQRRMVVLDALATTPGLYAVPLAMRVRGTLDVDALAGALSRIVARHEPLRTRIVAAEPEPIQEVLAPWPVVLEPIATTETALRSMLDAEARVPFDLFGDGIHSRPFRARLYRLADDDHVLALTTHHVATDRWSLDVLASDLVALLRGDVLPPLPRAYRDWAAFQRSREVGSLDAWRSMLEGAPAAIALPFDRPRSTTRTFEGARHRFPAPSVDALARDLHATPFMVHLAALAAVLQRAGAGDDLVIGAPIAGRVHADLEPLVGLFVNTLPLRVQPEPSLAFAELVRRVRATTLRAFAHQAVPFEAIVDAVAPVRSLAHDALVQVMLVVQNVPGGRVRSIDLPGAVVSVVDVETGTSKTDLTLFVEDDSCVFEYDRALFDPETIASLASAYAMLLAEAAKAPAAAIDTFALSGGPVLHGESLAVPHGTIVDAIRARAEASPHAIAIVDGQRTIDYVTLLAEVDMLAARLAVSPGARVGVALPRSAPAVVAVLAALVAGAAWVPLTGARGAAIEASAKLSAIVGPEGITRGSDGTLGDTDIAYVLFTSGTTGEPKGVVVPHAALANHMAWMARAFPLAVADRVLFRTSMGFDASVWELFAPLMAGATMVIADDETGADPVALVDLVARERVTVLQFVPTLLGAVLAADVPLPSCVRRVFAGGEALGEPLRRAFMARSSATLVNLYGPTEATIDATAWICDEVEGPTPIGRPIANTHARVLDVRGASVPLGFPGELWLGGAGLARGYLGDAAATRARFVTVSGERFYRTGDRVRQRPRDGALVYLGRDDDQVKVGGVRVELAEIEAILASVDGVEAAVASLDGDRLLAHVVGAVDPREVRDAVAARLPVSLAAIVPIAALPRTPNGKVDRGALPKPAVTERPHVAPEGVKERALARVFADVLGVAEVARDADFFGLGGDSIQSLYVVSRARAAGLAITPRDVFEAPSVAALAARASIASHAPVLDVDDAPFPLSPIQRWFFSLGVASPHHWNQSVMVDLDVPLDRQKLAAAVRAVVRHHPMLRARFRDGAQWIAPDDVQCFDPYSRTETPAAVQASLDLARGPVFRVALVDERRLLLVAHHLVVDAVSWSILQEDLLAAYAGEPLAPSASYVAWVRTLPDDEAPRSLPDPRATERTARSTTVRFTPEETTHIVRWRECVLLAALAFAVGTPGKATVSLTVESHGRDATALDVSRTVGWFTRLRTVDVPVDADVLAASRALERGGAGGALAPVVLNYLGRLDAVASPGARPAAGEMGPIRSPDAVMPFALDVTGGVREGALTVTFTASEVLVDAAAMAAIVARFQARVRALAAPAPAARFPLTPMQEGMLFDAQLAPGVYVQQVVCTLEGTLDVAAFRAAWDVVVARHDALRAAFDPAEAKQWVASAASMPVTEHVLDDDLAFERLLADDRARGFDLERPPAMRVLVVRMRGVGLRVVLSHHHVVLDGWSLPIVLGDVFRMYAALVLKAPLLLPAAPSFVAALPKLFASPASTDGALAGFAKATALPLADRPGPTTEPTFGEVSTVFADVALLEARARAERVTVAAIFDATWALLLARHAGTEDVVFGVTVAGRPADIPAGTVGMFVATIPLRVTVGEMLGPVFAEVHRALGRHGERAHVPIATFHAESDVPAAAPLFESVVVVESFPIDAAASRGAPGFRITSIETRERTSTPLTLVVAPAGASTKVSVLFDRTRFSEHAARTILARYAEGLGAIARGAANRREVTFGIPSRAALPATIPVDETIPLRFARVAARQPDAVAVRHDGVECTYRELAARAGGVASALRGRGVVPGDRVAVFVERSVDLVAAVLGILAAGAAYVPLDPRVPTLRRRFQVDDAKPRAIVVGAGADDHGLPAVVPGARAELLPNEGRPDDLAYVIYTSGSTGTPKGTLVTHRNVMRLFEGASRFFEPGPLDVWSFAHSIAFDFSVWEIFGALLYGGTVVVVPDDVVRAPDRLHALVADARVTILSQTPSAFEAFDAADREHGRSLDPLRAVVFGGEALRVPRLAGWMERHGDHQPRLVNMYGITETTVHVTVRPITRADVARAVPNESVIGRPLPDLAVEVRDAEGMPVPDGVPGELWVGGEGVARGYLARPELTAARFVDGWYRTGDRGRRDLDGELVHLGRLDDQVKLRGFRIELGEIEAVLEAHPEVRAAAVVFRDERLVAFVATTARPEALRAHAAARLYEAMVPGAFVVVDALPLTLNGKIDRARLAPPKTTSLPSAPRPLRDPRVALVAAVWAEVLEQEDVDDDADVFALGAHSLVAARAAARLRRVMGRDVPLKALFAHPTPRRLAGALDGSSGILEDAIPVASGPFYPLSFAQERLWFIERLAGRSDAIIPAVARFRGAIDAERARVAWRVVVQRHAALRTVFVEEGGVPRQQVRAHGPELVLVEGDVEARVREESARPFDLAEGPLARAFLFHVDAEGPVFFLAIHHIVADGWSLGVLVRDFAAAYEGGALPPLRVDYPDFAAWQRARAPNDDAALSFFREALAGAPPSLDWPDVQGRGPLSHRGDEVPFALTLDETRALEARSRAAGTTMFMTVLAALEIFLARISGQDDVSVGVSVAGRSHPDTEPMVGFFVNLVVVRARLDRARTVAEALSDVRSRVLEAFTHQDVPFERVVSALRPDRNVGEAPLFQVNLVYQNLPSPGALPLEPVFVPSAVARFDLVVTLDEPRSGALRGTFVFRTDRFARATITRFIEQYRATLAGIAGDPAAKIFGLPLGDAARAEVVPGRGPLLADRIARQAPDAIAVAHGDVTVTYRELLARAARLRGHLAGHRRVAIVMPARVARVAAVAAALSAGVAFVPIDPGEPLPRMATMLDAAEVGLVITDAETEELLPATSAAVLVVDDTCSGREAPPRVVSGEGEAYVVFTSGSTGAPKGVRIAHVGLANLADAQIAAFGVGPRDRVLAFASFGFDASISELAMALGSGATLDLGPLEGVRRQDIAGILRARAISTVTLPPSLLRVTDPADLPALRAVIAAGEACHDDITARWAPGRRFFNAYGPTETTVCATIHEVTTPHASARVPIGRAMRGLDVRVVDDEGRDVPCGVAGEIWVGGVGVALGYVGGAADAFVERDGVRFYRTGDLARTRPDGTLEFLRRLADDEVKVRGFRIALAEIELALASHPSVDEAGVAVRDDLLIAYVVGEHVDVQAIQAWVAQRLPSHMVPSHVVVLAALPRTTSGKLDRAALPAPSLTKTQPVEQMPLAGLETAMAAAWGAVLGVAPDGIGRDEDFFALGGHSLVAAQLVARVREALGVDVGLATIFEAPTLATFSAAVARSTKVQDRVTACDRTQTLPLSFAQERLWVLDQLEATSAYVLVTRLELRGALDRARLERALAALVTRHEPLRSRIVAEDGVPRVVIDASSSARGPIDLAHGPVFSFAIEARSPERHVLDLAVHHAVADAATVDQLVSDLGALYEGRTLPPLALQYADWAAFERRHGAGDAGVAFWREALAGAPETLGIGRAHDAPSYRAGRRVATLPRRAVDEAARRARVTPFMLLEAAFALVLARLAGRDEVVIGTPMTARPHPDTEGMVGLFMNALALRTRVGAARTLGDLLSATRATCLRAYAHADTPFERVASAVTTRRHLHQNPVFQAMFTLQARAPHGAAFEGLEATPLETAPVDAKLDLSLALGTRDDVYDVFLEHRVDVVDDALAAEVLGSFLAAASAFAANDEATALEVLVPTRVNAASMVGPREPFSPTFLDDVLAQVARKNDHLAVVARDGTRTYRELFVRAEALATALRERGAKGKRVAIAVPRGVALVETLLGVLAAGAAYVPLPEARAEAIARIAEPALRIDAEGIHSLDGAGGTDGAAYVLFTSGSTGEPKGVEIGHAALSNLLRSMTRTIELGDDDVVLAATPLGFDIAALELFGALVVGATVRIATEQELRDPRVLFAGAPRPTVVQATPSTWRLFLDAGADLGGIRKLSGGEALTVSLARELVETGGALWNVYGPTETTIWSTVHRITDVDLTSSVPIGRPIANTTLHLDARGELEIGGVGLGRYLGQPPFEGRYRTGDHIRVREDGAWIWSGRADRQVKVRGHRVELGEIEAALLDRGAKQAIALVEGDAISAFVTGAAIDHADLVGVLPEATIPARIVTLDALPLTAHGKIDHAALRGIAPAAPTIPSRALGAEEARVAAIWERLLGRPIDDPETSFFEVGGHSLLAARLVAAIRKELGIDVPLRTVFVAPTLHAFARAVAEATPAADVPVASPSDAPRPASFAEERMWLLAQVDRDDPSYHLPLAVRIHGPVDVARWRRALATLVDRHATLRTRFAWTGESLVATASKANVELPVDDVTDLDGWLATHVATRLDPTHGPIWHARIGRISADEHVFFVVVHHVAVDAWSMRVLGRELAALVRGETLAPLPSTYAAFAAWQRARVDRHRDEVAYWRRTLEGVTPLELPTDHPRTKGVPRGGVVTRRLPREAADVMRAFGLARGATPFMTFFAAWAEVLGRNASTRDVTVGVPVGGRPSTELEHVVGLFVNTVALRVARGGSPAELVARTREATLGALAHADVPFAEVVRAIDPPRDASRTPIFQTMFMLHANDANGEGVGALQVGRPLDGDPSTDRVEVTNGGAAFELTLALTERADGAIDMALEHREDLFDRNAVERLLSQYVMMLAAFPEASDASAIPIGPPSILVGPARTSPVVRRDPSAVAVRAAGASLTYAALDAEASRIATVLRERRVRDGSRVLLRMERSPRMIAAILGVWWAGGAYVAVDADWPEARIAWIRDHACVAVTITDLGIDDVTWDRVARAATAEPPHPPPDAIAYVLYTSGSSGEPKGVEVPHACVSNLADAMRAEMGLGPGDRVLQFASLAFDASVEEIAATLASGATLVLREPGPVGSVQRLLADAEREGVTVLDLPTAFWHAWCDEAPERVPTSLRLVVVGGEAASRERLARFRAGPGANVSFLNTYGPTEATVTATAWRLAPGEPVPPRVPIGAPIAGVFAYVLDDARRPVAEGVPGTLFLGGAGVARGYLGDLALTRMRFVDDPFEGARMFDTGDRVRLLGGALEFLGRNDAQIKVRGHRVEPTEVEAALVRHEAVREAAVGIEPHGTRLAAWIVLRGAPVAPEVLRAHLEKTLPDAFVPSVFVVVDALPLNAAGKIDRRRLPAPETVTRAHVAPRTPLEAEIAGLFGDLLGLAAVSVEDDFFALGGHSLLATQLLSRVRTSAGVDLPVRALFEAPTVAGLAACVLAARVAEDDALLDALEGMSDEEAAARLAALGDDEDEK